MARDYAPYEGSWISWRPVGDYVVHRHCFGTGPAAEPGAFCEFEVWEPTTAYRGGGGRFSHSSLTHFDDRLYGRIGSRALPPKIEALPGYGQPGHEKRRQMVHAWFVKQCKDAMRIAKQAFPEAASGQCEGIGPKGHGIVGTIRVPPRRDR